MMAAYFLKDVKHHEEPADGPLMRTYLSILRWTLANRTITLVLGLVLFAASIFSATLLPTDFVPASDEGRSQLTVELPPGATLEDTRDVVRSLSQRIGELDAVRNVFVDGGAGEITKATLIVNYVAKGERSRSSFEIEDALRAELADVPDVKLKVLGPDGQQDVSVIVLGDSVDAVSAAAVQLADDMKQLDQVRDVSTQASQSRPEIRVTPKPELAAQLGITASSLASTILCGDAR